MPKRQNVKRILSEEVQGEDSWVEVISPKVGEMKDYRESMNPLQQRIEQLKAEGVAETDARLVKAKEELNDAGASLITKFVKAWNWVDDDGQPLPPPSDPASFGKLTIGEVNWLTKSFDFSDAKKKP